MPKFHFYLVNEDGREHVGSVDLPSRDGLIPSGLKIVTEILVTVARRHPEDGCFQIQSTDDSGAVVYSFDVSPRSESDDMPLGYRQ